jgi:hypothetical protein
MTKRNCSSTVNTKRNVLWTVHRNTRSVKIMLTLMGTYNVCCVNKLFVQFLSVNIILTKSIYLYNKDQQVAPFTSSFIVINSLYMFRAGLQLIIRRYYSVYTANGTCHAYMSTGY